MMKNEIPDVFWNPIPLKPIAGLAELRAVVVEHNEKRMPKWKFRLADDLVLQIQPQLSAKFCDFQGKAVQCESADKEVFAPHAQRRMGQTNQAFTIYTNIPGHWTRLDYAGLVPGQWVFKPGRIGWLKGSEPDYGLCRRLVQIFDDGFFDSFNPSMVLSHHCMLCGKPLTDPASMARMIGPECYGSGSLCIPWLWNRKKGGE
jgi:hypothetical protein